MTFSLIIPTKGRVEEVARLFESLSAQSLQNFEVILSDQNDDNRLDAVVQTFKGPGRVLHLKSSGGASKARNDGLNRATGEIVCFPDDDCCYPPQLLEQVAEFFQAHPEYGYLGGRSYADDGSDAASRHSREASPIQRLAIYSQCIEFAFFIRRAELGPIRFDENMGVGSVSPWHSDEGPDLMLRLEEHGIRGYYDPRFAVWHPKPVHEYNEKAIDRSYRYACGTGYFLRKHRYPVWFFAYLTVRTFLGIALACLTLKWNKARFFLARIRGRWRGWKGYAQEHPAA
jgi:glycosyltransferase involved in cell wall biosynthesis